jgi:hypothetical protein
VEAWLILVFKVLWFVPDLRTLITNTACKDANHNGMLFNGKKYKND